MSAALQECNNYVKSAGAVYAGPAGVLSMVVGKTWVHMYIYIVEHLPCAYVKVWCDSCSAYVRRSADGVTY